MHRILVIRTIQGDQNVRRLHRDADLKMAGERKKNNSMAPDSSMYERCPPTPDLTNVLYSIHAPKQPNQFLVVLDSPTIESTKKRPKTKILERSPPRAPLRSVHAAAAPVEVTCPGCGFARAPSPARPGHQPPPAPAGTKPSHMRQQNASVVCA